jgi:hypothetical protein
MPRIPIFRLGRSAEEALPPQLSSYTPKLSLNDLQLGVDNLRHDVHLSPRFVEQARLQIARLIVRHGDMKTVGRREDGADRRQPLRWIAGHGEVPAKTMGRSSALLADLHVSVLNRAKAAENLSVDMLARAAIVKFCGGVELAIRANAGTRPHDAEELAKACASRRPWSIA